jgi:hypothetical protein
MAQQKVLIYGGRGGLGNVLVNYFKSNGCFIISVDLAANDAADVNIVVNPNDDWMKQVLFGFVGNMTFKFCAAFDSNCGIIYLG